MDDHENLGIWEAIAGLVNQQPLETRHQYREAIRRWVHDLGHNIGLIRTSAGLIRRESRQNPAQGADEELLGIIEDAVSALMVLLQEMRSLPEHIDDHPPTQKTG